VFQLVLPLHECVVPAAAESATAKSAIKPLQSVADSITDSAATGVAPTKAS
jgi:hypothetical protein